MVDIQNTKTEDLIKFIIDLAENNDISAYEIGKNSSISASSVNKIFSGENKSPKTKTLATILTYLENAIVGTKGQIELKPEYQSKAAEEPATYNTDFSSLKIDDKLNIIYAQNAELQKNIEIISNALGSMLISTEEEINKKDKQGL